MAILHDITTAQLRQAVELREQIESLQAKLDALLGEGTKSTPQVGRKKGKRTISPEHRAALAAAQQARWAKTKGKASATKGAAPAKAATPKKSKMTEEARAKIAAAMKARWAAKKKGVSAPGASAK